MSSSVPDAIAALFTLAATALPGVQLAEGQLGTYVADEQFMVGEVTGNDVPGTVTVPRRMNEDYTVLCEVRTFAGDVDPVARRVRVFAMYEAVRDRIITDPSLGGAVLDSWTTGYRYTAGPAEGESGPRGWSTQVEFAVTVKSQTVE